MKTLGVTGHSGSGKSTFARLLSDSLLGSKLIRADDLMYESILYYRHVFERIFGLTVSENSITTFRQAGIEAGVREWHEYLKMILPYMDYRINNVIRDTEASLNYIVIEWFHLPLTRIWQSLDCRVLIVAADDDIRYDELIKRMVTREQYRQYSNTDLRRSVEMKDKLSCSTFSTLMNCIVVKNSYDETLQHEAVQLAKSFSIRM